MPGFTHQLRQLIASLVDLLFVPHFMRRLLFGTMVSLVDYLRAQQELERVRAFDREWRRKLFEDGVVRHGPF